MNKIRELSQSNLFMLSIVLCGLAMRFLVATRGHNYDFESYVLVANIVDNGSNVYASTTRYNYGPIWFQVLHIMFQMASRNVVIFRYILVAFLSLVDLAIFTILHQKLGKTVAYLFFLNPISIIITGYHNQFDNLALLLGMLAVIAIEDNYEKPINKRKLLGLLILGLSLATKHVLFAFPIWLAVKQKGIFQKIIVILVPIFVFISLFTPYWKDGNQGIIQNVFLYKSFNNEYFYKIFIPDGIQAMLSSTTVWIILLIIFAVIFRQRKSIDSLLLYTCVLLVASPAIANQYLAIALPFVAANLNPFTLSYTLAGTIHLLIDGAGLHVHKSQNLANATYSHIFYPVLVVLLCLGFIWSVWSRQLFTLLNSIYVELKIQLGYEE